MKKSIVCVLIAILAIGLFVSCEPAKASDPQPVKVFQFFSDKSKALYSGAGVKLDESKWSKDSYAWYFKALPEDASGAAVSNLGNPVSSYTNIDLATGKSVKDTEIKFYVGDTYTFYVYGIDRAVAGVLEDAKEKGVLDDTFVTTNATFVAKVTKKMEQKNVITIFVDFTDDAKEKMYKGTSAFLGFDELVYQPWTTESDIVKYAGAEAKVYVLVHGYVPADDACLSSTDLGAFTSYTEVFEKVEYKATFNDQGVLYLSATSLSYNTTNTDFVKYYTDNEEPLVETITSSNWESSSNALFASDQRQDVAIYIEYTTNSNTYPLIYNTSGTDEIFELPVCNLSDVDIYLYDKETTYLGMSVTGTGSLEKLSPVLSVSFDINMKPVTYKYLTAGDVTVTGAAITSTTDVPFDFVINLGLPADFKSTTVVQCSISDGVTSYSDIWCYSNKPVELVGDEYKAVIYPQTATSNGTTPVDFADGFFAKDKTYTVQFSIYAGDPRLGTNFAIGETEELTFTSIQL